MKNIVLFASGGGSNAERIMQYFTGSNEVTVAALFSNNPAAGALSIAERYMVPIVVFNKEQLTAGGVLLKVQGFNPSLLVLAGFLWKLPEAFVAAFPNKIINIHPALLPKYGGKGMYGINVHRAVFENKDAESGITVHYVNEHYDEGAVIAQHSVPVDGCRTPEAIALKVQVLEHEYFPKVIADVLNISI